MGAEMGHGAYLSTTLKYGVVSHVKREPDLCTATYMGRTYCQPLERKKWGRDCGPSATPHPTTLQGTPSGFESGSVLPDQGRADRGYQALRPRREAGRGRTPLLASEEQ